MAQYLLLDQTGWVLYTILLLIGFTSFTIALAFSGSVYRGVGSLTGAGSLALGVAFALGLVGVLDVTLSRVGGLSSDNVALSGVGAFSVALAVTGLLALPGLVEGKKAKMRAIAVPIAVILIPYALGILLRSLVVRTIATLLHPISGLKNLSKNWHKFICVIDSRHPPELVP